MANKFRVLNFGCGAGAKREADNKAKKAANIVINPFTFIKGGKQIFFLKKRSIPPHWGWQKIKLKNTWNFCTLCWGYIGDRPRSGWQIGAPGADWSQFQGKLWAVFPPGNPLADPQGLQADKKLFTNLVLLNHNYNPQGVIGSSLVVDGGVSACCVQEGGGHKKMSLFAARVVQQDFLGGLWLSLSNTLWVGIWHTPVTLETIGDFWQFSVLESCF